MRSTAYTARLLAAALAEPLTLAAHTADPGPDGTQATHAADYPPLVITPDGWAIAGTTARNAREIRLAFARAAGPPITHLSLAGPDGVIRYRLELAQPHRTEPDSAPLLEPGALVITERA